METMIITNRRSSRCRVLNPCASPLESFAMRPLNGRRTSPERTNVYAPLRQNSQYRTVTRLHDHACARPSYAKGTLQGYIFRFQEVVVGVVDSSRNWLGFTGQHSSIELEI